MTTFDWTNSNAWIHQNPGSGHTSIGFETSFGMPTMTPMTNHCDPNDMKILGVDLDLDMMENGVSASEAFFEAMATPPPSPDSSSNSIVKSEYEVNIVPNEAKVVRIGNY